MGEFSASDCSWKKMVIAKATDQQWISTIKTEQSVANSARNINNFSLDEGQVPYGNVKREQDEINVEQSCQDSCSVEDTDSCEDPLLVIAEGSPSRRRQRKGSGAKTETPEERAKRLAKMSAYAAQRLANETPEQRAMRLRRMSEYAARRLAQETVEQRAKRLARMSAYAARRLAKETPEQRRARLARMSAYAARRHAIKKFGSISDDSDRVYDVEITEMAEHNVAITDMTDQS